MKPLPVLQAPRNLTTGGAHVRLCAFGNESSRVRGHGTPTWTSGSSSWKVPLRLWIFLWIQRGQAPAVDRGTGCPCTLTLPAPESSRALPRSMGLLSWPSSSLLSRSASPPGLCAECLGPDSITVICVWLQVISDVTALGKTWEEGEGGGGG